MCVCWVKSAWATLSFSVRVCVCDQLMIKPTQNNRQLNQIQKNLRARLYFSNMVVYIHTVSGCAFSFLPHNMLLVGVVFVRLLHNILVRILVCFFFEGWVFQITNKYKKLVYINAWTEGLWCKMFALIYSLPKDRERYRETVILYYAHSQDPPPNSEPMKQ